MKMSTSQLTILVPSVALVAHLLLLDFLQSALCLQAEESVYYWDSLSRRDLAASACKKTFSCLQVQLEHFFFVELRRQAKCCRHFRLSWERSAQRR